MTIETRDLIAVISVIVSVVAMVIVSRNARRATAVNAQNLDLARIRDLRSELKDTEEKASKLTQKVEELSGYVTEANERAIGYARREAEMLNYARMPGMDMERWLRRFDPDDTHEIARR